MADDETTVAIACQGGGSHTAFTGGVLSTVLDECPSTDQICGFSGTSGGAICATLAWYGSVHPDEDPGDLLAAFWSDLAATTPVDRTVNELVRWGNTLQRVGVPFPQISPAKTPTAAWGQRELRRMLESVIEFDSIPAHLDGTDLAIFISAIDVCAGTFEMFREDDLTVDHVLASAAEPHLFEAVELENRFFWDGLFAKNPPITHFMDAPDVPDPDEVWVITINPQERPMPPRTREGIDNRRNELAGNLSMNAEIRFVNLVNEWIDRGYLPDEYTRTEIKRISLPYSDDLDWRTKLDRDPTFIRELFQEGKAAGRRFLTQQSNRQ